MDAPALTPLAAAVLHVPAPERALVIGCGDGEPALFLTREFPAARVRAVDRSAERIREAQGRTGLDPEGRLAFKQAPARTLPYPDEFFDLVAQVKGPPIAAELARVLRTGGHLILAPRRRACLLPGAHEKLDRARLSRAGFLTTHEAEAGDGNFLVARLGQGR